jgi:hypothetical protein
VAERAEELTAGLRAACDAVVAVIQALPAERWLRIPAPGVWSIGKDVEHLAEAALYHHWIVRRTIGDRVPSRRPPIERAELTTRLSIGEAIDLLRERTRDGAELLLRLTDEQLGLPTRPARGPDERLAGTIQKVLIGHYAAHLTEIEAKIR